ncbi:MAG: hypothetical protein K2O33_08280, partial [Muribaculaceae bacterium]|nr:hypothetical protein [Muribaculaceae bacterium]
MASQRLSQTQGLRQRLTPQQVQFVRMLEMNGPEIEEEVRRAVEDMPALEAADPADQAAASPLTEDGSAFNETPEQLSRADFASDDDIPDNYIPRGAYQARRDFSFQEPSTSPDAYGETLYESLTRQLEQQQEITDEERLAASHIIGNLDDNGYLTRDLRSIADDILMAEGADVPLDTVRRVWRMVRSLDPAGIGAVDLRDCLLLQLDRMPRSTEQLTAREVVRNYFDLFSKRHFDKIASSLGITREALDDALAVIGRLSPKPGALLAPSGLEERSRHITPAFLVEPDPEGNLTLPLLNRIPELTIARTFADDTPLPPASRRETAAARLFIKSRRDDAQGFIRLVSMRQEALYRVMAAIMATQREFFLTDDPSRLRPMVLRDIAAMTGYDLSVVSRATQGKYVATPTGLYPLKMPFNERSKENDDT